MASQSNSSSSGQSSGNGSTYIPNYPQSAFLQSIAQQSADYANQAYGRYNSADQPLENSLISDSQQFQNPDYLRKVGGEASGGAAQAGEAQRTNSLRDLEAFGIDPSGGRYAELDQSERGRTAATQAGSSQLAMRATQQAGRDMRMQALGIGQKNLDRASHNLDTASNLKYPPLGQAHTQQSTNGSSSVSRSQDPQQSGGGGNGNGNNGGRGGGGNQSAAYNNNSRNSDNNGNSSNSTNAAFNHGEGGWHNPAGGDSGPPADPGAQDGGSSDPGAQGDTNWGGMDYGGGDAAGNSSWQDPGNSSGNQYDSGNSGNSFDTGQNQDSGGDYSSYDAGSTDSGGGYEAGGGEIDGQQGGAIPTDDSPSGGQQVDDVNIHANAGEFMIPKDVAAWKGQEFFQKLIATSRQARVTAPAHGTSDPAQAQQQGQAENRAMGQ